MRLMFVSSCLEPGADGVGDYLHLLGAALAERGHLVMLLAINDKRLKTPSNMSDGQLKVVRYPASSSWEERSECFAKDCEAFDPDFVSVHVVPFALGPRGVIREFRKSIKETTKGQRVHIFFHELWLGIKPGLSLCQRLLGWMQKREIQRVLTVFEPVFIQTTNPLYVDALQRNGYEASIVPLFGTIPPVQIPMDLGAMDMLVSSVPELNTHREHYFWFQMLFTLHPQTDLGAMIDMLEIACEKLGKKPLVVSAGSMGAGSEAWNRFASEYSGGAILIDLGKQKSEFISALCNNADCGISLTPFAIKGKSSALATMREHGLPIVFARNPRESRTYTPPQSEAYEFLLPGSDADDLARFLASTTKSPTGSKLDAVAKHFERDFETRLED